MAKVGAELPQFIADRLAIDSICQWLVPERCRVADVAYDGAIGEAFESRSL